MRGLLIGRFQPFHSGHLEVARYLRERKPDENLLLGIGSSEESFTPENPFTASERAEMIALALAEANLSGCLTVPIPDIDRHALWAAHVREVVPPFDRVYTNNPLTRQLFERDGVAVESTPLFRRESLQGLKIRSAILEELPWTLFVPPAVAEYLGRIEGAQRVRLLGPE
ncbi:MAG: nicotinamide-nucleotide adenylyltransferase [Thermoplasmata archaeon]|nr:nicotinamide-nucleotide adenylyltransferase [Thermoplasmata archaeon]MCI4359942.1 nicotinamide-nucleotide adenylyltransferase [Thermoplasmata archaeon]